MEKYTVFVASPSDVKKERDLIENVIKEINLIHGPALGYELELWRYEENAYPSAQKPQDLINSLIKSYQIFIGMMWKRFGTATAAAGSGTEEEYTKAYKAWQNNDVIDIMFYFCKKPIAPPDSEEEIEQMGKVLKFKKEMNGKSFIWDYSNPKDFEEKIRKHLSLKMSDVIHKKKNPNQLKAKADAETINTFKNTWDKMTPELQSFLCVPYNENRMKGDGGIQTRDLFAAMVTNPTSELQCVIRHLPKNALPEPLQGKLINEPYIANEQPWLSHCISSSIKRLSKALPPGQQLTALDVFIDIARNGTGESVNLLRKHNIYRNHREYFEAGKFACAGRIIIGSTAKFLNVQAYIKVLVLHHELTSNLIHNLFSPSQFTVNSKSAYQHYYRCKKDDIERSMFFRAFNCFAATNPNIIADSPGQVHS